MKRKIVKATHFLMTDNKSIFLFGMFCLVMGTLGLYLVLDMSEGYLRIRKEDIFVSIISVYCIFIGINRFRYLIDTFYRIPKLKKGFEKYGLDF